MKEEERTGLDTRK